MYLTYEISPRAISDCTSEGIVEKGSGIAPDSELVKHQVDRDSYGVMMAFPPFHQGVSPETPKLRSARSDLEPMVANEEEVVRVRMEAIEVRIGRYPHAPALDEDVGKDAFKDFGRHAHGYVQQRIPGAFELDYVTLALFYLFL